MLTGVPVVDQKALIELFRFGIISGDNILILGPSGGGKTLMALDAAEEFGCHLIYVNLSVLERTDFQGMPVISEDKSLVSYATPDFLPFSNVRNRDQLNTLNLLTKFSKDDKFKKALSSESINVDELMGDINHRFTQISTFEELKKLNTNLKLITDIKSYKNFDKVMNKYLSELNINIEERPIVFLFDEVDKASHEVLQTLLEFLQFHSVNGRQMKIKSCFLTGNLPDEFAMSQNISHAITKRCMTYKLQLDFNQWREWAYNHGIHEYIIAFLSAHNDYLYKKAPDGDPTAYALPSPRTWTSASKGIKILDNDNAFKKMLPDAKQELMIRIVAGNVGDDAAIKFSNWIHHFREMDPIVMDLIDNGKYPPEKLDPGQIFICALSACSKVYTNLIPNNYDKIEKYTKNVFKWLKTLPPDIQMGSARIAFGGDFDIIKQYNLQSIPEFVEVFKELKKLLAEIK